MANKLANADKNAKPVEKAKEKLVEIPRVRYELRNVGAISLARFVAAALMLPMAIMFVFTILLVGAALGLLTSQVPQLSGFRGISGMILTMGVPAGVGISIALTLVMFISTLLYTASMNFFLGFFPIELTLNEKKEENDKNKG